MAISTFLFLGVVEPKGLHAGRPSNGVLQRPDGHAHRSDHSKLYRGDGTTALRRHLHGFDHSHVVDGSDRGAFVLVVPGPKICEKPKQRQRAQNFSYQFMVFARGAWVDVFSQQTLASVGGERRRGRCGQGCRAIDH